MRHQELLTSTPKFTPSGDGLGGIALFFDLENILLGVQGKFVVDKVVEFLAERGEVMILRAYADWGRYRNEQRQFLEAGVQMVFLPSFGVGDKNRTDTAICVDAMEILFTRPHIETFAIVSGDSDFGVLAQRLRDHGKRIVGMSAKSAASHILVKQCHEFVFYETLVGQRVQGYSFEEGETRLAKALDKVVEDYGGEFRASVLKDLMRKQDPTFSERNYGAASFTQFLRSYGQLVTLLDGGLVRVGPEREDDAPEPQRAPRPRKEETGLSPEDEAIARDVLMRAFSTAAARRTPVRLSRLKDALQSVAPDFDEANLGFRTFTRFLKAFPDIIALEREGDIVTPTFAMAQELGAKPTGDGAASGRRRGGEGAPGSGATSSEAPQRSGEGSGRRRGGRSGGGRKRRGEEDWGPRNDDAAASDQGAVADDHGAVSAYVQPADVGGAVDAPRERDADFDRESGAGWPEAAIEAPHERDADIDREEAADGPDEAANAPTADAVPVPVRARATRASAETPVAVIDAPPVPGPAPTPSGRPGRRRSGPASDAAGASSASIDAILETALTTATPAPEDGGPVPESGGASRRRGGARGRGGKPRGEGGEQATGTADAADADAAAASAEDAPAPPATSDASAGASGAGRKRGGRSRGARKPVAPAPDASREKPAKD